MNLIWKDSGTKSFSSSIFSSILLSSFYFSVIDVVIVDLGLRSLKKSKSSWTEFLFYMVTKKSSDLIDFMVSISIQSSISSSSCLDIDTSFMLISGTASSSPIANSSKFSI